MEKVEPELEPKLNNFGFATLIFRCTWAVCCSPAWVKLLQDRCGTYTTVDF